MLVNTKKSSLEFDSSVENQNASVLYDDMSPLNGGLTPMTPGRKRIHFDSNFDSVMPF
jgi:hypothetical protein